MGPNEEIDAYIALLSLKIFKKIANFDQPVGPIQARLSTYLVEHLCSLTYEFFTLRVHLISLYITIESILNHFLCKKIPKRKKKLIFHLKINGIGGVLILVKLIIKIVCSKWYQSYVYFISK